MTVAYEPAGRLRGHGTKVRVYHKEMHVRLFGGSEDMDKNQSMSPAADAQRKKLRELIVEKKGKGGASQLEAKQFTDAWIALAKTVGINDETVSLLYDGFQFAAGEPFYRYVSESKSKVAYHSLFNSKSTMANEQGIAFRVAINLFALELPNPTTLEAVNLVALTIPRLSVNKDGEMYKTLGRSIGKILIKPLVRKSISPDIHLTQSEAVGLLAILKDPVENYSKNPKIKSVESKTALSLLAWLYCQVEGNAGDGSPSAEGFSDEGINASSPSAPQSEATMKLTPRAVSERPVRVSRVEPTAGPSSTSSTSLVEQTKNTTSVQSKRGEVSRVSSTNEQGMHEVIAFLTAYQNDYEDLKTSITRAK